MVSRNSSTGPWKLINSQALTIALLVNQPVFTMPPICTLSNQCMWVKRGGNKNIPDMDMFVIIGPRPQKKKTYIHRVYYISRIFIPGCSFFVDSWKLPAYSGACLLTVDNLSFFTYNWSFFTYTFSFFSYSGSFLAYGGKVRLISVLRDCKQRSSTVSKKAPTVSKKASPMLIPSPSLNKSRKAPQWVFLRAKQTLTHDRNGT